MKKYQYVTSFKLSFKSLNENLNSQTGHRAFFSSNFALIVEGRVKEQFPYPIKYRIPSIRRGKQRRYSHHTKIYHRNAATNGSLAQKVTNMSTIQNVTEVRREAGAGGEAEWNFSSSSYTTRAREKKVMDLSKRQGMKRSYAKGLTTKAFKEINNL